MAVYPAPEDPFFERVRLFFEVRCSKPISNEDIRSILLMSLFALHARS